MSEQSGGTAVRSVAEAKADKRRLRTRDLFFLAAGGVIGSGWLLGAVEADQDAGSWALLSWLIGGLLMLVIAAVMVELAVRVPKTGGLIFLPLQSSGPLLATVVAAGIWVFYTVNPASEAIAMVRGFALWTHRLNLVEDGGKLNLVEGNRLTWAGFGWALFFMTLVTLVNLLGRRLFVLINNALTAFKILIPLLVIGLLVYALLTHPDLHADALPANHASTASGTRHLDFGAVLTTVASGGVIYAYLGFQGPLDFAGHVRRDVGANGRNSERRRLRRAVYGTVCGSIFLYTALQCVVIYIRHYSPGMLDSTQSPYSAFAKAVLPHSAGPLADVLTWLINLDTVLSPAGSALVYTYVLTREVAALSRAHLTHRGLQKTDRSVIPLPAAWVRRLVKDERLDVYWQILIVDFLLSTIALLLGKAWGWALLSYITSMLSLIVYATPGVVLAALCRVLPDRFPGTGRRYRNLARLGFVLTAIIYFLAGWAQLWRGFASLTVGCVVLFLMPHVASRASWYDATSYVGRFAKARTDVAAQAAVMLYGFFFVLTFGALLDARMMPDHPVRQLFGAVPVALLALLVFGRLVALSEKYMRDVTPALPPPTTVSAPVGQDAARPEEAPAVT
jgi:amino acid transporter